MSGAVLALVAWIGLALTVGFATGRLTMRGQHCPHTHVRGIYGDEINHTPGYRRNECLDCGRLLDGPVSIAVERRRINLT
jgi:hypothetical protein